MGGDVVAEVVRSAGQDESTMFSMNAVAIKN